MLRGTDDVSLMLAPRNNVERLDSRNLQELHRFLAADISFAIHHSQWALSHGSPSERCVDVRTSIWRNIISRAKDGGEFNLLRSCMHNLKSIYTSSEVFAGYYSSYTVHSASLIEATRRGGECTFSAVSASEREIATGLKWAAASFNWPAMVEKQSAALWMSKRGTSSSSSFVPGSGSVEGELKQSQASACALGFQSPFAKAYIKSAAQAAEELIKKGAYIHRSVAV